MMPANPNALTARLRTIIAAEHEAIEQTSFSVQMMAEVLPRSVYALNLAQMFHIQNSIESLADSAVAMRPFFEPEMRRTEVAAIDLINLGFEVGQFPVLSETQRCLEHIDQAVNACPVALIGGIYVLEGSRMGSLVLARPLAKCLAISGAPGTGIDYHIAGAAEVRQRLKNWKAIVDQTPFDDFTAERIEAFAKQFMVDLLELYRAMPLEPVSVQRDVA